MEKNKTYQETEDRILKTIPEEFRLFLSMTMHMHHPEKTDSHKIDILLDMAGDLMKSLRKYSKNQSCSDNLLIAFKKK